MSIKYKDFLKVAANDFSCFAPKVGWTPKKGKRKVGDIWEDRGGRKWIQKNGYVASYNEQADSIREQLKKLCGVCKKNIDYGSRNDVAIYKSTGNCFDCQIEYETKLRFEGKYPYYEKKKMTQNELSEYSEFKQKIREGYYSIKKKEENVFYDITGLDNTLLNEDKWSTVDSQALKKSYIEDYKIVCKHMYKLKKYIKELDKHL